MNGCQSDFSDSPILRPGVATKQRLSAFVRRARSAVMRKRAGRSKGVSEFKFVSAFRISPSSVIFSRPVASGQSRSVSVATRVERLPQSSSFVASRRVACASQFHETQYLPKATSPGRPITPKSVISTALLKARRVARVELLAGIASRLAALKVPAAVQLRPVALRQRSRLLS
jgi:hypothetical protein